MEKAQVSRPTLRQKGESTIKVTLRQLKKQLVVPFPYCCRCGKNSVPPPNDLSQNQEQNAECDEKKRYCHRSICTCLKEGRHCTCCLPMLANPEWCVNRPKPISNSNGEDNDPPSFKDTDPPDYSSDEYDEDIEESDRPNRPTTRSTGNLSKTQSRETGEEHLPSNKRQTRSTTKKHSSSKGTVSSDDSSDGSEEEIEESRPNKPTTRSTGNFSKTKNIGDTDEERLPSKKRDTRTTTKKNTHSSTLSSVNSKQPKASSNKKENSNSKIQNNPYPDPMTGDSNRKTDSNTNLSESVHFKQCLPFANFCS